MSTRFDPRISVIRVCAMLSIIAGHWLSMQNINHFQFGAIGVEIFFFVSGYLYSDKKIYNVNDWMCNRWHRLIIPYWIVLGGCILLRLLFRYDVTVSAAIVFFLNLQGIDRIFRFISLPVLKGMGQTWFLTVLVICYMAMLLLKKIPKLEQKIRDNVAMFFLISVICQILLSFVGVQIIRPLCFFYGYFWNKDKLNMPIKKYSILTLLLVMLTAMRFVTHTFCDNSMLYDYIVFGWSFVALAIWLIITAIKVLDYIPQAISKIVSSRAWKILDLMTYPLFLTHYMFASGEFAVIHWVNSLIGQIVVFIVLICTTAFFVLFITDYKKIKRIIESKRKSNEGNK